MARKKPEMAPKKPTLMEDPPTPSSDDSKDEDEDETEVEETSSDGDDENTPDPTTHHSSPPPMQPSAAATVAAAATPHSESSDSEDDSGSDSDSDADADSESEPEPEQTRQPIATKPASKRPNEANLTQKDAKRAKKNGVDGGGGGGGDGEEEEEEEETKKPLEETKRQLFQRLWSEDDEIAVLKGMLEFSKKQGVDPNQDMNAFHDFIKTSLHVDVSRNQLADKIRRLKKKYENNLERGLKKGEDRTFSKPHEQQSYDLSKRIWGTGAVESAVKSNGKTRTAMKMMEVDNDNECSLKAAVVDVNKFLFAESIEDYVISNGLDMIGGSKKVELEMRWKKLRIAQLELYIERSELVKEQAVLMLNSLKSSSSSDK